MFSFMWGASRTASSRSSSSSSSGSSSVSLSLLSSYVGSASSRRHAAAAAAVWRPILLFSLTTAGGFGGGARGITCFTAAASSSSNSAFLSPALRRNNNIIHPNHNNNHHHHRHHRHGDLQRHHRLITTSMTAFSRGDDDDNDDNDNMNRSPPSTTRVSIAEETKSTTVSFVDYLDYASTTDATVIVGKASFLRNILTGDDNNDVLSNLNIHNDIIKDMIKSAEGGSKGGCASSFVLASSSSSSSKDEGTNAKSHRFAICVLPEKTSRNNHPMSVHRLSELISSACGSIKGNVQIVVVAADKKGDNEENVSIGPLACAIARVYPLYSRKTRAAKKEEEEDDETTTKTRNVLVSFLDKNGNVITNETTLRTANAASEGVRLASRLGDAYPEELTTDEFASECRAIAEKLGPSVTITEEIVGEDLDGKGYGGLYGVGKAATCPPRLVVMTYTPPGSENDDDNDDNLETVALVGKGIVYDTGGLSLKGKTGMPGMKSDMCGAAGLFGGFVSAAMVGVSKRVYLVLCLAENAIGPKAVRNDDILNMHSGKTVEINNSDAEGRLVLADGVSHATTYFDKLDLVVDMATLTGAQLVATGQKHGGVLANTAELEERVVSAGLQSGDLCFPLLYAPELLMAEFDSKVADMKNSVKDRGNAQSSCAGHFIEEHLNSSYEGGWVHIDMAGPSTKAERSTGYGVGLVLSLLGAKEF